MIGGPISAESLTLYGSFTSSSSYKPMLYLALAGLPFSFRTVNLKIGVQSTPEYLAINRWGVVPSLRRRGLTILQSNVILDYLARETRHFEGRTEQERWQAREWLSWEADHITAVARVRHSARFRKMHDEVIAEFRPRAEAALSFVDNTVKDRPFLVGDECTIADIGCWGRMVSMAEGGFEMGHWPHLEAWAARLKAMPGFALPYDLIPARTESSRQRHTTRRNKMPPTRRALARRRATLDELLSDAVMAPVLRSAGYEPDHFREMMTEMAWNLVTPSEGGKAGLVY
jgi:glutathione S-transferase